MGNCKLALANSSTGTLTVTAQVQTSAMWVQEADGKWKLVVANAADPAITFIGGDRRKKSAQDSQERKSAPVSKTVSSTQDSVSHGGS